MARTRDLWFNAKRGPAGERVKSSRHPDNGGNPDAKRWLAVWMVDGREHTQAFAVRKVADRYASEQETDVGRGEFVGRAAGRVQVEVFARKWLRLREVGAGSGRRYASVYGQHIAPRFGQAKVSDLRASVIAEWSRSLADRPATRRLAVMILRGVLDLAVADGALKLNPAKSAVVVSPPVVPLEREPWPVERIRSVAAACGEDENVVLTAAGLGLREGEVFGLAADDFDGDVLHLVRQVFLLDGEPVFKLPKGGKVRDVPVSRGVAALVSGGNGCATTITLPWLDEDGRLHRRGQRPVRLVFTEDGRPWIARHWERLRWAPARKAAGVDAGRANGMHALRHWYSTTLLDAGVSLAGVTDFMGHSRQRLPLTAGIYGHVTDETREAARRAVDSTLFRLRSVPSNGTVTELRRAEL